MNPNSQLETTNTSVDESPVLNEPSKNPRRNCQLFDFATVGRLPNLFSFRSTQQQAKEVTELALKNNIKLMEIEFPTASLEFVPGDGEGGIEMNGSMQLIREFCGLIISPEKTTQQEFVTVFPEANEVTFARKTVFGGSSLKLDYLTKPSLFQDFGVVEKVNSHLRILQAATLSRL